ncbi:MAG: cytochrome c oxidase accessory protein CcoG, partial [Helicobacter sp.]|nr:cytochrome c oxidase accessory protein CcoG [Helicobacter sp.]
FYFEVQNNTEIQIKRPSKPFRIEAGEKSKQVVVLYTEANLAENAQKDTHIPLEIKAYAVDSQEPIEVFRKSVFIYPPNKSLH